MCPNPQETADYNYNAITFVIIFIVDVTCFYKLSFVTKVYFAMVFFRNFSSTHIGNWKLKTKQPLFHIMIREIQLFESFMNNNTLHLNKCSYLKININKIAMKPI